MISEHKYKHHRLLLWMTLLATASVLWWAAAAQQAMRVDIPAEEKVEEVAKSTPKATAPAAKSSSSSAAPVSTYVPPATHTADGKLIVRYTNTGFSPAVAEVKAGVEVHFINESSNTLYVTSKYHPTGATELRGLDFGYSLGGGQSYDYLANQVGTWGYYNLNNKNHLGTLVITQ